jgi:uncharacterized RDD family membrane protein YckC
VGGPVRLDTVVRRRDRAFTAATPGLVTALLIALLWPPVLVVCWGILEAPWLSLGPGLLLTGGVIWWGVRLGRIGLAQSREAAPYLIVTSDEVQVWNASVPGVARLPRDAIRAVAVDAPARRQRRANRVRFAVGDSGWLYCPDDAALPTISYGAFDRTPNLAVLFRTAVPISAGGVAVRGFLTTLTDPNAARAAFGPWLRPFDLNDVHGLTLPVRRLGRYGVREVRPEDRVRARLFDAYAMLALFIALGAWLAQPGGNQLPALAAAALLAWMLYDVAPSAVSGQTLGKTLLGLRAVRADDGSARLGLGRAFARSLLRLLNGLLGGKVLGHVAPKLDLTDGVGAGTLLVADGEYRRLRALPAIERERALTDTALTIQTLEPMGSRRAAWAMLIVVLLIGAGFVVGVVQQPTSDEPGPAQPGVVPTTPPERPPPLPTAVVPPPSLPRPTFDIPAPTLDWPEQPRRR